MSLMDVETTPEAIQEDQELIEAVEQLVETAAASVETAAASLYSGLMEDFDNILAKWKNLTETMLPMLVYWRNDEALFWDDLHKMCLTTILFLVGFVLLAPYKRRGRRRKGRHQRRWFSFRKSASFDTIQLQLTSNNNVATTVDDSVIPSSSDHLGQRVSRRHSVSDWAKSRRQGGAAAAAAAAAVAGTNSLCTGRVLIDDEDETEEEKFEKMWSLIRESDYGRLVLPPHCKLVEKPKHFSHSSTSKSISSKNKTPTVPKRNAIRRDKRVKESMRGDMVDDDHPMTRIRNYTRQFFKLVISLLRYDYVGAGWTLIDWIQSCIRKRQQQQHRQQQHQRNGEDHEDIEEDDEDDESDAGSSRTSSSTNRQQLRRCSLNSVASNGTAATANSSTYQTPGSPSSISSSRRQSSRASIPVALSSNKTNDSGSRALESREDGDKYDELTSRNDTRFSPRLTPLTVEISTSTSLLSNVSNHDCEAEEKKESPSELPSLDDAFSSIHLPVLTPHTSNSSCGRKPQSASFNGGNDAAENELAERVATRLAAASRRSLKARDALEPYRQNPLRLGGAIVPPATRPRSPGNKMIQRQQFLQDSLSEYQADDSSTSGTTNDDPRVGQHSRSETVYFETVNSQESLRKLTLDVPVPDRNGYILGDDFLPDNTYTPLLVFVNSRSGPQQGHLLITQLRRLLNPIQVWDLADGGPEPVLESFNTLTRLRILVCGGDGTVSWIVSTIEKMKLQRWPPIAILPLGTGNDLARIHGWGGGYNNESLIAILEQVTESYISWLDRWEMTVENKKGKIKAVKSFFNYLGVGADAQAALQVHMLRESQPQLFFSRVVNKAWYGIFGAEDIIKATSVNLPHDITLIADGVEVPLPADSQGIILLNIDSYAGGVPLWSQGSKDEREGEMNTWLHTGNKRDSFRRSRSLDELRKNHGRSYALDRVDSVEDMASLALTEEEMYHRVTACDKPSSCQDGLLDIVSIRGAFHLGQIRVGLSNAQLLCQCREVTIHIKRKVSVQTDGEPWRQNTCTLRVKRKPDAAIMLHRSADESNGVETEVAKLLDWAEEKTLIDSQIHAMLMKEFSRRIESKTRQRRVRSQDNKIFSLKRAMGSTGSFQHGHGSMGNIVF